MSRKYQVILFGATGFSGRLAAEYFVTHYCGRLRFALAGRSKPKLETLRTELEAIDPAAADIDIVLGDSNSQGDMEALACQTDVVATTAGPFALYGETLLQACAKMGTHYCDLTGEPDWVALMEAKYNDLALASGARIVPAAGFDSVPSDLGTYLVVRHFQEKFGAPPERVEMFVTSLKGGLQGGTAATVIAMIENPTPAAPPSENISNDAKGQTKLEWTKGLWYDSNIARWTVPFFMAPANQAVVKRSNARLGYSERMDYRESSALPFVSAVSQLAGLVVGGLLLLIPPTRWLIKRFALPQPGQGPSRDVLISGKYKFTFVASGGGNQCKMNWAGKGDPGGIGTTILLGESAACLALEKDNLACTGGVLTPVSAMGDALWKRIQHASWSRGGTPDVSVQYE